MAKMKISELATEINVDKNEIVAFLQSTGFEVKSATKSIEDEQIEAIKAKFAPKPQKKAEDQKKEEKPAVKKEATPVKEAVADTKKEAKGADAPLKKKKKSSVIIIGAGSNALGRNARPGQAQSARPVQAVPNRNVVLGPNQMINKATGKIMEKLPPKKVEEEKPVSEPVKETNTEVKTERDTNANRGHDTSKDRQIRGDRNEANRQQGEGRPNRNFDNGNRGPAQGNKGRDFNQNPNQRTNRNSQGDQRPSNRDGRPSDRFRDNKPGAFMDAPGTSGKPQDNRRGNQMGKDKRSKKDAIYEEEEVKNKNKAGRFIKPEKKEEVVEEIKVITLPEVITIKELAEKMKMQPSVIVKKLFLQGQMVTVNQEISYEEAENIAIDYDIMCEQEVKVDVIEELLKEDEEKEENLVERAPVICVMGHVDHGKTSLLDAIRKTNVTDKEAGGITQHIGAYMVEAGGRKITFLDTPGHEAFTAMRMRGANATDIAILVVAADDGVMPQTVEAINHAKAAGIEIIVAVNKIDKPNADINRVKQELAEYELIPEDWGGSTVFAPVSAKTGEGIKELLDMVLLTADILELKANPKRKARGLVIEAELDKGRGPVATILMQKGTLKVGDFVSAGACYGKVRAMLDDKGRRVKEAGPSTPVEILGLNDVPEAGEVFIAHDSDKTAKSFADTYKAQNKVKKLEETKSKMSLDDVFSQIKEGNLKELNLIVKADVQGSVEAVKQSLVKLSNDEVVVKCIHGGVGAVNESDVSLAAASNAIIIGFNVRIDANAKETAEREGVDVRLYKVIYQAIDDVEAAMKGMLDPIFEEKVIGHAEVRQIFKASAVGNIAGSYVTDGMFQRGCKIRITRAGEQIYEGELASLKRFKDDVKEVKAGYECGLVFEKFDAMAELDIVEAYIMVEVPR
jgi:translation initiation factor IF-2